MKKFNFWNRNKGKSVSSDCTCGCSDEARDSVRLTDAEIAQDIIGDLQEISREYDWLSQDGCDVTDKLRSCDECLTCLCDYVKNCGCDK